MATWMGRAGGGPLVGDDGVGVEVVGLEAAADLEVFELEPDLGAIDAEGAAAFGCGGGRDRRGAARVADGKRRVIRNGKNLRAEFCNLIRAHRIGLDRERAPAL